MISSPVSLSAKFKGSFAYKTVKDRMPVILTKVIDYLYRERETIASKYDSAARDDLKDIISKLSKLRSCMQTNKPIVPIEYDSPDTALWNDYLALKSKDENGGEIRWFDSAWLIVECYMYRKIWEAFEQSTCLKAFDPFFYQKVETLEHALGTLEITGDHLLTKGTECGNIDDSEKKRLFEEFIQLSLWANRNDLSISAGALHTAHSDPLEQLNHLKTNIIVNQSSEILNYLTAKPCSTLGLILDNSGLELLSDFMLIDYLCSSKLISSVKIYVKTQPWFISDTTLPDINHALQVLKDRPKNSEDKYEKVLPELAARWEQYLASKTWEVVEDFFWTGPHKYCEMKTFRPTLYTQLAECDFLIFKGDLNYRKLMGDLQWPTTTSFDDALQGFHPAPLVAIRTLKAEVVTGLQEGEEEALRARSDEWLTSGDFGVIQFSERRS